ncbi:MAG: FHA domain-containing protein [Gemmataceae bacterium]
MSFRANGELVPSGGGDNIPLIREKLTVGRRESCDICLRFPNISGVHAELSFRNGYWYITDRNSTNGIKVNGVRVQEKLLHPKDRITIGKRDYHIQYELPADMVGKLEETQEEDIMSVSLLEKAGLKKPERQRDRKGFDPGDFLLDDE